ncbi:hypothetical protein [Dinoroseobacter sp. S76]|uniref:hypothetical protein n=1 Tax=Dinoroseobacter sp. S76 TaxID=3415124 RepID=UPI003C7D0CD4
MTVQTPIPAATSTRLVEESTIRILPPAIDERQVRRMAITGGVAAARTYAGMVADQLNGGLRAQLVVLRDEALQARQRIETQIADYEGQAASRSTVRWRRLQASDARVRMTRMEVVQATFYVIMTLVALTVATVALAMMMMELETIEKVTDSIWTAVIYAFPVVLASSGVASMLTLHDDDKVIEQRAMRAFRWGFGFFAAWILLTSVVFVGANGGFNAQDLLSESNNPFEASTSGFEIVDKGYVLLGALFPSGVTSSGLMVVHIIAEVLIAAGLTARVILMGRKTREIAPYICPRAELATEQATKLDQKRSLQNERIAGYDRKISEIDAVRAKHIEDVALMASSEERVAASLVEAAKAKAEHDYLRAAREAAPPPPLPHKSETKPSNPGETHVQVPNSRPSRRAHPVPRRRVCRRPYRRSQRHHAQGSRQDRPVAVQASDGRHGAR